MDAFECSGFPGTPLDCSFVSFFSQQTLVENFLQSSSSWRWESGKRSVLSKRSVFSTAIKRPPAAAADVDTLGRWTTQPRPCEPACSRSRPRLCCAEHAEPADAPTARILLCRT